MNRFLVSCAAYVALTLPVLAADIAPAAFNSGSYDWSGFYAGIFGGYGGSSSTWNFDGGPSNFGVNGNGGVLGGDIGVNAALGDNFVVGGEGSLSWDDVTGSTDPGDGGLYSTNLNWMATLTAKLGFTVDRFLIYADAGGAIAGLNQGAQDDPIDAAGVTNFDSVVTGWTAGVGAEYALTDRLSVNLKYAYADFGTKGYDAALSGGSPPLFSWSAHTASLSTQTITAGLNYKF